MADGGATEVRPYRALEIDPWTKNPRTGKLDVSDILATLTPERPRITEPLRLRLEASGRYTALKGNRRLMAAAIRGIEEVPGILVTWTDEEALDEALVDEARKALTPLEEAAALAQLRARGLDVGQIAGRAGRTVRHVHKRLALVDHLGADGRELLAGGGITLGLAEQLAALSVEAQARAVDDLRRNLREGEGEPLATRDARWSIDRARLRLKDGGFPLDDATLVPDAEACTTCPKRSGTQIALFLDGLTDQDLCGDEACFKGKRAAQLVRLKARAKEGGFRVVDKPAEVKKLFPYGSNLAYDAPFVDLGERCDLVRPPATATKNEGRKGGPETCTGDGEGDAPKDGKHDFARGIEFAAEEYEDGAEEYEDGAEVGDEGEPGCKEAFAAGCAAWVTCGHGCGGWEEIGARPGAAPKGWKPPTWGEVLREAIAKVAPAGETPAPAKPDLVAEDGAGGVHELVDKKAAVKLLRDAGLVDKREAERETERIKPPKKPGELDKFEVERKAREAGEEAARAAIVAKAAKKAADVKFWRFLTALVLRSSAEPISELVKRRGIEVDPKGRKHVNSEEPEEKALLGWVAEQKDEGQLRALVVELLVGDAFGTEEAAGNVACRFYGVDLVTLQKNATDRVKAEAKEKAAAARAKEKQKASKKTAKASPAPAAAKPPKAKPAAASPAASTSTGPDACQACGCTDRNPCKGECVWVDDAQTICSNCGLLAERVLEGLDGLAGGATGDDLAEDLDGIYGEEGWYSPKHRDGAIRVLAQRGRIVLREGRYVLPAEGIVHRDVKPENVAPAPTPETVQLAGEERKAAEARPCPRCKAKAGKGCVSLRGKLGTGWFHTERAPLSIPAHTVDPGSGRIDLAPEGAGMSARGPTSISVGKLDLPPPKAPPAEHKDRRCAVCGCSDAGACQDTHADDGWCTWERLGEHDVCSVCLRGCTTALKICQKAQSRTALVKALSTPQKDKRETWDEDRAKKVVAHLEQGDHLGKTADGKKLLAAQPA